MSCTPLRRCIPNAGLSRQAYKNIVRRQTYEQFSTSTNKMKQQEHKAMDTFSKPTFSATSYAAFRPTYPPALYDLILDYHHGPQNLALDLGCGTGIVTRALAPHFAKVIGTDPSPGMIKQATEQGAELKHVEFRQGSAERSEFLKDGEVDLVVAGQAAHWFDYPRLWAELGRIVRKDGTVAFWGYKDPILVDYPAASAVLDRVTYGMDPEACLGSYWSQPGRSYVQNKLRVIQPPTSDWDDLKRWEFEPATNGSRSGEGQVLMEKDVTMGSLKSYWRTFSSFHAWKEAHQDQVARAEGGEGDLVDRMVDEMIRLDGRLADEELVVRMEWGGGVVVCRRR